MASTGSSCRERDKSEHVAPTHRARIRNPRGAARRDLGVAGPHPQRVRTRRVARTSGPNPLVSGAFAAGDLHPTLTSAIPFCDIGDNRPWLAFFEATQCGVTARYVLPMQIEWVRFDRERYNPTRARGRAPGRAGRHAAGCRDRPHLHRAAAAQSAREPDRRRQRHASRIQADQQILATGRSGSPSRFGPSRPNSSTARRWSITTMSSRSTENLSPAPIPRSRSGGS